MEQGAAAEVADAVRRVLRPIVRLLIRSGVTFPILADLLRGVYVDVAAEEFGTVGPLTDSRLSLLTGIHRKELRRQRLEGERGTPAIVTLNSQIIARWLGDPVYAGPDGTPAPLSRSGPAPSFDALVESVTRDVRPRTVLDSWLETDLATLAPDGRVQLKVAAFLPRQDAAARLYYFTRNLHDHAAAAVANLLAASPRFMERSLHYDRLGPDAAAALERAARAAAEAALLHVNKTAIALTDSEPASTVARTGRVNFGVYVYCEDHPDAH